MKLDSFFTIVDVKGSKYILPYGPNAASYKSGVKVDEAGLVILEGLEKGLWEDELTDYVLSVYELGEDMREQVATDIREFCKELSNRGMLNENDIDLLMIPVKKHYINIAGINISIVCEDEIYHSRFRDFEISADEVADFVPEIVFNCVDGALEHHSYGGVILKNRFADVYECEEDYTLSFTSDMYKSVSSCVIRKNEDVVDIYYQAAENDSKKNATESTRADSEEELNSLEFEIFDAMRMGFFYHVAKRGMHAIHSVSILYNNKAWLFSGPSGTGKSTHTAIWKRVFDTPILNGDVNLLAIVGGRPVIYGIPWCGTSQTYTTSAYELGGIVILKQSKNNRVVKFEEDEKVINIANRFFSPNWKKEQVAASIEFASALVDEILVCKLECNMEDEAAATIKRFIDKNLEPK